MTTDSDSATPFEALDAATLGVLLEPGDSGYDDARTVWNARVDREPAAILRCTGTADVIAGVNLAREHDIRLSVKGGGHHVSGSAVCDDGLVLDLGPMDWVRVDPDAQNVRVGPGATWGDVDHETSTFGLAVPGGQDPNIGVPGLTLGGGVGWLTRKYGLTSDNLLAADVVTADGNLVHASEDEHEDLFWAIRGGGGGFGVVTAFEFQAYEVPEVFAGSLVYPMSEAREVARRYESFTADAPPEARLLFGSMHMPSASYLPPEARDTRVAIVIGCYAGSADAGKRVLEPLRSFGDPLSDTFRARSYTQFQQAGESQGRMRTHLRSNYLDALREPAIETIVEYAESAPSKGATIFASPRGCAETEPPSDATAYPHRDANHHVLAETRWQDPERDDEHVDWVDAFHDDIQPYTTDDVAMSFLTNDEPAARVRAAYGDNYERLVEIKQAWDPENRFRASHLVDPNG